MAGWGALEANEPVRPINVAVPAPADNPEAQLRELARRRLYIVIEDRDYREEPESLGERYQATSEVSLGFDPELLADRVAHAVRSETAATVLYRSARPGEVGPYLEALSPDAVLRLIPTLETSLRETPDGRAWAMRALIEGELTSLRRDGSATLRMPYTDATGYFPAPLRDRWYTEQQQVVVDELARGIARWIRPLRCSQARPLHIASNLDSVTGWRAAVAGKWSEAEDAWKRLAGRDDWRAHWNIGVSAELQGEIHRAREYYSKAKVNGAEALELETIDWPGLFADLNDADREIAAESTRTSLFSPKTAVLPFTDETVSIDGPVMTRRLVSGLLGQAGYSVIPLKEVDLALRDKGITQGGHLKPFTNAQLAEFVGAQRLVFGHLTYFQKLPIRTVSGEVSVWNATDKGGWPSRRAAATERPDSEPGALLALAGGSWSDSALLPASEALWFARRALGSIPKIAGSSSAATPGIQSRLRCNLFPGASLSGVVKEFRKGIWGISADDGRPYYTYNLPLSLQKEGMRVRFKDRESRQGFISEWGDIIEASTVEELGRRKGPSHHGTVRYFPIEGGFFGIVGNDGKHYEAQNLPPEFRRDGMRIRFWIRESPFGFYHMWGNLIDIESVEHVGWDTEENKPPRIGTVKHLSIEKDLFGKRRAVKHPSLERGFFAVIGDDGRQYDPKNLPEEFQHDEMRIRFRMRKLFDDPTDRKLGERIEVLDVEAVGWKRKQR